MHPSRITIADTGDNEIEIFNSSGQFQTRFGSGILSALLV